MERLREGHVGVYYWMARKGVFGLGVNVYVTLQGCEHSTLLVVKTGIRGVHWGDYEAPPTEDLGVRFNVTVSLIKGATGPPV